MDWPALLRRFVEREHWHPDDVADRLTVPRLWLIYGLARSAPKTVGWAAAVEAVNRKRMARGLPPVPPPRPAPRRAGRNRKAV
jgi:hypothetical protein